MIFRFVCYNQCATAPRQVEKGGAYSVSEFLSFIVSVLANVMPQDMHDMVIEFLGGNVKRAMELQLKYVNLIQALFCEVNPIPVKAAMKIIGYEVGGVRLPLTEMEENHRTLLKDRMKEAGLIWQDAY